MSLYRSSSSSLHGRSASGGSQGTGANYTAGWTGAGVRVGSGTGSQES